MVLCLWLLVGVVIGRLVLVLWLCVLVGDGRCVQEEDWHFAVIWSGGLMLLVV